MLLPTLAICCGGTVFGVPIAWVLRETIEASKGAPSPHVATDDCLSVLGYNNDQGLLPILDNDHQDKLTAGWRAYRKAMDTTKPPPSRLEYGALTVGPIVDGRAEVTVDVSAVWWGTTGGTAGYRSQARSWRFETREDNGWQVTSVDAPAWCGGYVRTDACA